MGDLGEHRGTRTGACTDISPLACTPRNTAGVSAAWKSGSWCGKPVQRIVSERQARLREAHRSRPGPRRRWLPLEQPGFREAKIALGSEDEMVVHGNVQEPPGVDELPRDGAVIRAWRGVAAGMVMG